jgi:hypothetical protein
VQQLQGKLLIETMMKNLPTISLLLLVLTGCEQRTASDVQIAVIGHGRMPAVTTDSNKTIHLVYGSGDKLMYTFSHDEGKTFAAPELVANLPALLLRRQVGPQIAAVSNGVSVVAVNKEGDIFSYVKDGTGKWSTAGKVNDADTTDKEGFIGLSSDNKANLFAIWTDLRGDHQNKIFGAMSNDGGKTWSKNILIYASPDGTICECCKPSVAMHDKEVSVMFRNWLNGNRDLYWYNRPTMEKLLILLKNSARKLGIGWLSDGWRRPGC